MKWEYKIWPEDDICVQRGHEPPKRIGKGSTRLDRARLRKYGGQGWELTTICDGLAYFKRPKEDYGQEEETTEETCQEDADQEDTHQPKSNINPGELYRKAYAHITEGSS